MSRRGWEEPKGFEERFAAQLTDHLKDMPETYYEMAARTQQGQLQEMAPRIWVLLMHMDSTNETYHHECHLQGHDSWCCWQRLQGGRDEEYNHHGSILRLCLSI